MGIALKSLEQKDLLFFKRNQPKWPFLEELVSKKFLAPIDYYFAENFCLSEEEATLICIIFAISRLGHLCLQIESTEIFPSLECLVPEKSLCSQLEQKMRLGIRTLACMKMEEETETDLYSTLPICRFENRFYLQKNWIFETRFLQQIERLIQYPPSLKLEFSKVAGELNLEQKQAIEKALHHSFTLIIGGPGTGKTYTAAHIVKNFLDADNVSSKKKRIILGAPTGKAAARLESSLRRFLPNEESYELKCGTLHSLLNLNPYSDFLEESIVLDADLILVDEASMIDLRLFSYLLPAISSGTRFILMGDPDQLPPVGSGSLFADLILAAQQGYPLAIAELNECHRCERQEIIELAQAIKKGEDTKVLAVLANLGLEKQDDSHIYIKLWNEVRDVFPHSFKDKPDPLMLLEAFEKFRILSCMRIGPLGVDAVNQMLEKSFFQEVPFNCFWAVPILIVHSDDGLKLYNGETGVLLRFKRKEGTFYSFEDYAIFPGKNETVRLIPAKFLPKFELAYCLSVHKSQGSEYEKVLLLVPNGSEVFGREILYTAVTRARLSLKINGEWEVIKNALRRVSRKISGFHARIKM